MRAMRNRTRGYSLLKYSPDILFMQLLSAHYFSFACSFCKRILEERAFCRRLRKGMKHIFKHIPHPCFTENLRNCCDFICERTEWLQVHANI